MIPKSALNRKKEKNLPVSVTITGTNLVEALPISSQTLILPYVF